MKSRTWNIRSFIYWLRKRINLQFIKHSYLDMKRDKAKALFGIFGIAISICLMTSIGMVNDTLNYNYMQIVTNTTGEGDIMISKQVTTDLTFDPYFDQSIIEQKLGNIEGVEEWFPRILQLVQTSSENTNASGSLQLYGIDFKKEAANGHMGNLIVYNETSEEKEEIYMGEPADGECVILRNVAKLLNVSRGDVIHVEYGRKELNLTVVEICEQDRKFMEFQTALILITVEQAQKFLDKEGQINFIYGTLENPELIYDSSNLDETTRKLRAISEDIQERLDINEYTVSMPKLEELESSNFTLMSSTILFWFVTILSMLITGILIHAILSTSSEERVREFGILRTVGGKKGFPIKIVLFEGFLIGVLGSLIGIIVSFFITPPIASVFFSLFEFEFSEIVFIIKPATIILSFSIGSLVSLVIALLPAVKTARIDIIKSITPFRTKDEGWEVKKEGSANIKSFLVGVSVATIGMVIFVMLPNVFMTGDMMVISGLFIGLLSAILIGMVFASVAIIPLIQQFFLKLISPFIKKYANIINISLKRNRRRNTSTTVMFAISFSFIFFITTYSQMSSEHLAMNLEFQYASDLVLINQGSVNDNSHVDLAMYEQLKQEFVGIDKTATSISNTIDITAAISVLFSAGEEGIGFEEDSESENQITSLISFYSQERQIKYETEISDIAGHDTLDAGFIGIDENFPQLIDRDLIIWSSPNSGFNYSFTQLFKGNRTCIIAKSIADVLGIRDVGEQVRLTFYNPQVENDPGNVTLFTVVGIAGGIPGFFNFRSSQFSANGGGVMVSQETYIEFMDVESAGEPNMVIDKIYINLRDTSEKNIDETINDIRVRFNNKKFILDDVISKVKFVSEMYEKRSILFEFILMFTIVICIFGLVSSMYAVFLERKFEIGILRSMGMKTGQVRNMFLIESMLLMISSGIMGTIIGSYSAYLMETNISILTEMPVVFTLNWGTLLRVFLISISVGIIFMYIILFRISRVSIMEIFRQTF
ncbi:MAG: ABC transporter permease [Promethearchaeota archaeon]